MLVLFDWKKIKRYSNNEVDKILLVMYYITYRPVPKNIRDPFHHVSQKNWGGTSFLVNPEMLFENQHGYTKKEVAEYIALASFRNYGDYKATKTTTLDLFAVNIPDKSLIENNRLLTLKDNKIHFKWESVPSEK